MKFRLSTGFHLQKGFTLVELLVVLALTGVAGTVILVALSTTFRNASKSDSISTIQQNGNFVMAQMTRMIRFASILQSPSSCYTGSATPVTSSSISILNQDNNVTTFACDTNSGSISSNSANLLNGQSVAVTACSFSCIQNLPYDSPTVTISFTLNKKNSNNLVENNSPISFTSSVNMRNSR